MTNHRAKGFSLTIQAEFMVEQNASFNNLFVLNTVYRNSRIPEQKSQLPTGYSSHSTIVIFGTIDSGAAHVTPGASGNAHQ